MNSPYAWLQTPKISEDLKSFHGWCQLWSGSKTCPELTRRCLRGRVSLQNYCWVCLHKAALCATAGGAGVTRNVRYIVFSKIHSVGAETLVAQVLRIKTRGAALSPACSPVTPPGGGVSGSAQIPYTCPVSTGSQGMLNQGKSKWIFAFKLTDSHV